MLSKCFNIKGCIYGLITDEEIKLILQNCSNFVVPNLAEKNKVQRDGLDYHITIISSMEMKEIKYENELKEININIFGVGIAKGCYFLVCGCKEADDIRKKYKLPIKQFHITLGFDFEDNFEINKGIRTIVYEHPNIIQNVINSFSLNNKKNEIMALELYERKPDDDIVLFNLSKIYGDLNKIDEANNYAQIIIDKNNENQCLGYYIILKIKKYLGLLTQSYIEKTIKILLENPKILLLKETKIVINIINKYLLENSNVHKTMNLLNYDEMSSKIIEIEMPNNFSFVDEYLAGSGNVSIRHIQPLSSLNFTSIISLREEQLTKELVSECKKYNIKIYNFSIPDRHATSDEMIEKILDTILNEKKTLVHCLGGIGRTNMILICYMIKQLNIAPAEAITILSNNRKVILTQPQIIYVKRYYGLCNMPKNIDKIKRIQLPGLIMLIGIPCSGKTTFSLELLSYYLDQIIHLNQDEIGRSDCDEIFLSKIKSQQTILLDRCNILKKDRKEWIDSYKHITTKKVWAIYFDLGLDVSLSRLKLRKNHPTLIASASGSKIIEDMSKKIDIPVIGEGFDEIITIKSDYDLINLKMRFGFGKNSNSDMIMKFPRTKHFTNLGSMSRDDLLLDIKDITEILKYDLLIEEKVDGANLGFFLDKETQKIRVQNRSHFVDSTYHEQFKLLDKWITDHRVELYDIFEKGNYILFGEWLYFKHSIHYTKLPDYFLIYDIFDKETEDFLSREIIVDMLKDTTLHMVPIIYEGKTTLENLKNMVNTISKYYDGKVEGIYIRAIANKIVKYRSKIVRSDFIAGQEISNEHVDHWTKTKYIMNTKL
jgi:protein-tyrosine phosphatase